MHKTIIFAFAITLLVSCNTKTEDTETQEIAASTIESKGVTVTTSLVKKEVFQKQIVANGKIEALQKSELRFKTSERIASIHVKNGQRVSKGQLLATLDSEALANTIQKAEIELEKAENKFQEEKINYGVANNANISDEMLKNLQIKSGLFEAKNALKEAQLQYNQTKLRAPFAGVIANIEAKTGNYATSSDVFCIVISQNQMEVVFSVLENELPYLSNNQDITITSFVNSDISYKGSISEINPLVDNNGLIKIKAKINRNNIKLFDGMHVKVHINHPIKDIIVVPKTALVLRSNLKVVFIYDKKSGLAKWKYVDVLAENSTVYAISKGLAEGQEVIISGNINLSHDAKVNVNTVQTESN